MSINIQLRPKFTTKIRVSKEGKKRKEEKKKTSIRKTGKVSSRKRSSINLSFVKSQCYGHKKQPQT